MGSVKVSWRAVADALGVGLKTRDGVLVCASTVVVDVGGIELTLKPKVAAHGYSPDHAAVVLNLIGDLHVGVVRDFDARMTTVFVIGPLSEENSHSLRNTMVDARSPGEAEDALDEIAESRHSRSTNGKVWSEEWRRV